MAAAQKSASSLKLFHCVGARSIRVLWTMKEMELTGYQLVTMPFPPRFLYRDFLKVSRNQPAATTGSRHTAVEHAVSGADD